MEGKKVDKNLDKDHWDIVYCIIVIICSFSEELIQTKVLEFTNKRTILINF